MLEQVGLAEAGDRRVKGYSMGMRQRLAIAAALLGDPEVLILDEPANGLDPPGIRWMRDLLRHEAGRGRAVLVSSHLLSEVAQSVDDVVVISHGELRASGPLDAGARRRGRAGHARARRGGRAAGAARCARPGRRSTTEDGALVVRGVGPGGGGPGGGRPRDRAVASSSPPLARSRTRSSSSPGGEE